MIQIPASVVENAMIQFKNEIDTFVKSVENKLIKLSKDESLTKSQKLYLSSHVGEIEKIVKANPKAIVTLIKSKGSLPGKSKKNIIAFKDKILKALNYSKLRTDFYPLYFQKIGIKSCIYCNAQLTVCIEDLKKNVEAKFQLDHYFPKSEYPFFSISFYNLYPVCASCNHGKGVKKINFKLYGNSVPLNSNYKFELNPGVVAKYLISRNLSDIEINFTEPKAPKGYSSFDETFKILGIYNTQKDIAEEIILKSEVYKKAYKKTLVTSFPRIFTDANLTNRLILGNYTKKDEIHKRPMAKFTQDIARQLKLIP